MNTYSRFIKDIAVEHVTAELPTEAGYLDVVIEEMGKLNYTVENERTQDTPLGLGANDILQALQSPTIVAILSSVWLNLVVPLTKDILRERLKKVKDTSVSDQVVTKLSRRKLRDYIKTQGKKINLSDELSDQLAARILDWLRRHPEDIANLS